MKKLSGNGQKILKIAHLITASCWVGGALSLVMLYFLKKDISEGAVVHGVNLSTHYLDWAVIIIPGATGCFLTGLIYSVFTNWGFFKHRWITVKWIITITAITFGTFFLGPWETRMMNLTGELGTQALTNSEYLLNQSRHFISGSIQLLSLIFMVAISVLKPWRKRKQI
ncbi:DUF2269 family protein [Limisalsivibrio acetivorans]|uniref:DUF2269 family protein n=1 Tax=Limisalsivibrio acetivorans TaxID=1304888 RepID=UPI0003B67D49|nr:DUF2269 family protein [Limisalsivibrio acetivorans]